MDENLSYLEEYFVPLGEVAEATGVETTVIQEFIEARLVPGACYFPDGDGRLTSNLGSADTKLDTAWLHPSSVEWTRDTEAMLQSNVDNSALATQRHRWFNTAYLQHVQALRNLGLVETAVWDEAFADEASRAATADSEFGHWMAGTYGLCTRANTPEAVAVKECMVRNIDHLTQNGDREDLPDDVRASLVRYIRLFDHVAALFAPFERAGSSRQRLCVDIPRRHAFTIC